MTHDEKLEVLRLRERATKSKKRKRRGAIKKTDRAKVHGAIVKTSGPAN